MNLAWHEPQRTVWSPARIAKLCDLYGRGLTFAQIAPLLGATRSGAIGRFNRLREQADMVLLGRHDDLVTLLCADAYDGKLDGIADHMKVPVEAIEVRFAEIRRGLGPQAV